MGGADKLKRRKFSREFKLEVLQELDAGRPMAEICRQHEVGSNLVCRWRREYEKNPEHAFSGKGNPSTQETKVAQLERKIGQLYLENEFIKKVNADLQKMLAEVKKKNRGETSVVCEHQKQ